MSPPSTAQAQDELRLLVSPQLHEGIAAPSRLIETHMSWVVLSGARAFKLKKPVRNAFADYTTPAARERDARAEVALNRRLAPGVYLGVLAIAWRDGELALVRPNELPAGTQAVD